MVANRRPGGFAFEECGARFPRRLVAERFERSLQVQKFRLRMLHASDIGIVLVGQEPGNILCLSFELRQSGPTFPAALQMSLRPAHRHSGKFCVEISEQRNVVRMLFGEVSFHARLRFL
jgi:hypothetical protein